MQNTINILLVIAVIIPVVFLFWPFAEWNGVISLILRVIPSVAVQALLCRICKKDVVNAIPVMFTGVFATWGTYLYFTSPHWSNATVWDLVADYISPFVCCIVVFLAYLLTKKHK